MDVTTIARITERRRARRGVVGLTLMALLASMLVWSPAASATIASAPNPATWGTNGTVHSLLRDGNILYIGGTFTAVVSPDGSQTQPRNGLAAIDLTTGQPTPWNPNVAGLTATVFTMAQSGQRLFVGGDFSSIGGQARSRLAAIDTATGAPISTWTAGFDGKVRALAIAGNALYVGGSFEHWKASAIVRLRLAAVDASTGDLLPWAPSSDDSVRAIEIAPDGRIIVGGLFTAIDGDPQQRYLGALDGSGNPLPWASRPDRPVLSMAQGNGALYSGSGGEPGGYAWAHNLTTGAFLWSIPSDGDVQGIVLADGRVVLGGHFDVIGSMTARRLAAVDPATGAVDPTWIPDVNGALGVSAAEVGGDVLYIGGDFTTVGGISRRTIASFDVSPESNAAPVVSVTSPADGDVYKTSDRVSFRATATDFEDGNLSSEISWSSSLDGKLGRGGSVIRRLSIGTHRITAKVKDSGGRIASSSFTIEVMNSPPRVIIKSPIGGSTYRSADPIPLAGTATDYDDGDLTSAITWSSSIDGRLGTGGSLTRSLSSGTHTITASVTDRAGATKAAAVTVTVTGGNAAPVVAITAPADGTRASIGTSVALAGTANDPEQGNLGGDLIWTSSIDGKIGTGPSLSRRLSEGTHAIRAKVTDSAGAIGRATITVIVGNAPPEIHMTSPADGSSGQAGAPVAFQATATDAEDGSLTSALAWTSNLDGPLGSGGSLSRTLSVGTHTITATVTDSDGASTTATATVTIARANTPPTIAISGPADGEQFRTRDRISFSAAASDSESGDISSSISWESSIDGPLGTGGAVTGRLSKGTHTITASVTDDGGLTRSASITVIVLNTPPQIFLTSPTAGATFSSGDDILFQASAEDFDDGDLGASIEWTSSIEGPLGTGPSHVRRLRAGVHTITASVTDSDGAMRKASITVTVTNSAPTVNMAAPANGATFRTSNLISFQASAADNEDGNLTGSIAWSSNIDGPLGTGGSFTRRLSKGTHVVTARATDSGGLTRTASVTVNVTNSLPTVAIQAPSGGSSFATTDAITFRGTASDFDDGDLTSGIQWSSSIDGPIGSGGSFTRSLSSGSHTITARAEDADGGVKTATVTISVGNTPPAVTIQAPASGGLFQSGDDIQFQGTASDVDDGDLTSNIAWTSSIDGPIGGGGQFTRRLSPGSHTITARVADSRGASRTASVTITVADTPPTISIQAPADHDTFTTSDAVAFSAEASDVEDGDLSSAVLWTSDRDGVLGTGASLTRALSRGTHVITASVTDSATTARAASITITVGNSPPRVSIQSPVDGSAFSTGQQISFRATADDIDQADLTGSIVWTSSVSGNIGTGGTLTRSLPAGVHVITAQVTDDEGATRSGSVAISVGTGAPTVSIQSPSNGAAYTTSQIVTFQGTASDPDDGSLSASISWSSSRDGALGTGSSLTRRLSKGTHDITARVTDSDGLTSVASVTVTVANSAPSVSISSPSNGASFLRSDNISFQGSAADFDDGGLTSSIAWSSSRDGALGTGTGFTRRLSKGVHVITASVTDADGSSGTASVTITVANTPPTVTITSPSNGATFVTSDSVSFQGAASDFEQGSLTGSIAWTSSRDGAIGSGGSFTRRLSKGSHTITASITDADGATATASVTVTVGNTPPTISISSPAGGSTFKTADQIQFTGGASDFDQGSLTGSIAWTSSRDGAIGTGGSFSRRLSKGSHTITASVTDADGATRTATASITVTNSPPVVTISAPVNGASFKTSDVIQFSATASDFDQGGLNSSVAWSSSRDGSLGSGATFSRRLTKGTHTITASVTDADGATTSATVNITVANTAPTVSLTSPANGAAFKTSDDISFQATASDFDQGSLTGAISWSSSKDGPLGSGGVISRKLSKGTHIVTASVTDADGGSASATATITVANTPPSVSVSSPAAGSNYTTNDSIQFTGGASDFDQGNLSNSMTWTSSLDGAIGAGGSFTKKLTAGSHVITARVTDADGASAAATVTVNVESATAIKVQSISYATSGGPLGDKHVDVTIRVVNGSNAPLAGASISFDLYLGNAVDRSPTGLTDASGTFTYQRSAAPAGCYRSVITSATATGFQWDGRTPTNNFCKST